MNATDRDQLLFRQLFELSPDPAWIIDGNRFVECNEAARKVLGYTSREAFLNIHPSDISPPTQPDGESSFTKAERMMALAQDKGLHRFEWLHTRVDGSPLLAEITLSAITLSGHPLIYCTWRDISERKQQEAHIQDLLDEQQLIFENAEVGILLLKNRRIIKCNQHIADMIGLAHPAELEGQTTEILYGSPEAYEAVGREAYSQLSRQGFAALEPELHRRDGSRLWTLLTGRSLDRSASLEAPSIWVFTDITERKQAELALRQTRQLFSSAFESSPIAATISTAADGRYIEVNTNFERDWGWRREETIGKTSMDIHLWPDTASRTAWIEAMRKGRLLDYECVLIHKSGEPRHASMSSEIVEMDGSACILAYISDISERKRAEADLRIAATAFESQECMVITDANGVIQRVNLAFSESTGYRSEELIGETPRLLKSNRHDDAFFREMWETLKRTGNWQGEVWDQRKDGQVYPKWLTISSVRDEHGKITHYIGSHHDITERKQAEEKIKELAFFDQLTGLPNRTLLQDRLKQALAASSRSGSFGALLFIDLDNFKTLNDTQGHDIGDLLLKQVALRLKDSVREGDTVARLGGDEFVVVLPGLNEQQAEAATAAEIVAEKVLDALNHAYQLGEVTHHCSASIGVTLLKGDLAGIDELMKQADLAMYQSKEAGRNRIRFFDRALEAAVKERAELEADLRQALLKNHLLLHYQPQIAGDRQMIGAEVLVRWQHPARGMISPAAFIPLAEETGLILPLGNWVMETACRQLVVWANQPELAHLTVAVNVSARQIHHVDFVDQVMAVIDSTGANPRRLKLELTESVLVENIQDIINKMSALKDYGINFSLDDFGTGYSSLAYLKQLPLDQLKIDQSFVRDVLIDPNDAAIAKTIIALAQSLGLGVIAEGVETAAQRDFLKEAGCPAYQGYFFSRPLPLEAFEAFAKARHAVSAN